MGYAICPCSPRVISALDHLATTPRTVLVVDDYPSVLRWVCRLFEQAGWRVVTADSGDSAVACWMQAEGDGQHIDLLVTDLLMPEMDGQVLATALRRLLPVIAITGSDDALATWVTQPLRNAELLVKPVLSETLLSAAARLTRPAPAPSPALSRA